MPPDHEDGDVYIEAGEFQPKAASDFSAAKDDNSAKFRGIGLLSHAVYFDPTDTLEDNRPTKVFDVLKKATTVHCGETLSINFAHYLTVYNDMSKVSATSTSTSTSTSSALGRDQTVQDKFLEGLKMVFGKQLLVTKKSGNYRLSGYGCGKGPASEESTPDAYLFDSTDSTKCVRGIIEVKHSTDSPHVPLRQGISEAINVAIMQLEEKNAKWDEVMVFVIGSNGYLLQAGVVFVLYPSFPVFVPLTSCLDMTNDTMRLEACRALCCIRHWIENRPVVIGNNANDSIVSKMVSNKAALSTLRYHMKELEAFFSPHNSLQTSLHHYFRIMARLHQSDECRPHVVFPICVREYEENINESCIVFPKMNGYHIGFPEEEDLRRMYFEKLKTIIDSFHVAGVVHLDLYPSNIMWKYEGEKEITLKVIDWDSGHFINEDLSSAMFQILADRKHLLSVLKEGEEEAQGTNLIVYDLVYYRLMENNFHHSVLCNRDKATLDTEFKRLRDMYKSSNNPTLEIDAFSR